ncbi:hypothetical protein [Arthrobacter sp. CG_A4]|uniref:hypothetical protein n=1 Tax=Arthrobacter sp. CG_A4 TaxID=3071706 RepID=UPI002DFA4B34|nr:hypothetical protein [Arthrobacter sp. CG_A4]
MHPRTTPAALLLAAFLALAGCGTGTGTAPAPATTTATPPATATPTPAKTYSNADLTGLLSTLKDSQGRPLTVIPAAQIDEGIIKARELLKSAVVTPEACKVFVDSSSQVPEDSTYAGATTASAADKTAIIVTVIALKDAKTLTGTLKASRAAAEQCKSFTIEVGGQKVTSETTPVVAVTSGDDSYGALTKQTLATGATQTALTVTGIKGNLAATVVKGGATVTPEASAELTQMVNTILGLG